MSSASAPDTESPSIAHDQGSVIDAVMAAYMEAYQDRVRASKSAPVGGSGVLAVVPLIMSRIGCHGFTEADAGAFARAIGGLRGEHALVIDNGANTAVASRALHKVLGKGNLPWYIGDLGVLVGHAIAGINRTRF